MSKELTDQWWNGTLPQGWYYLKVKSELANYPVISECVINCSSLKPYSDFYEYDDSHIEEVLSAVPSYDEIKRLQERLEIATKALLEIQEYTKEYSLPSYTGMLCHKALKEMEGVK